MLLLHRMLASVASGELPFCGGGRALGGRIFAGSAEEERLAGDTLVSHPCS